MTSGDVYPRVWGAGRGGGGCGAEQQQDISVVDVIAVVYDVAVVMITVVV